jgi:hypothetical protein
MTAHLDSFHPYTQQHDAGVHANCRPATNKTRTVGGAGSANACALVAQHGPCVERWHSHDFGGPLVCGCDDFATVEGI